MTKTPEQKFEELAREDNVSVRKYFMVLRLAIYNVTGDYLEKSHEIALYNKTDEIYRTAIRILRVLEWSAR